jgi:hypothetical protein
VYKIKLDQQGKPSRKKARLVVRGFKQTQGIDFEETFAPVVRLESLRLLIALSAISNWNCFQLDIKTAFLYGTIDHDVYMEQPQGYELLDKREYVCLLKKSLYGLKQAPRLWNRKIRATLELGFKQSVCDNGIFILNDGIKFIILTVWVDDIAGFCNLDSERDWRIDTLKKKYDVQAISDLEYILGVEVKKDNDSIKIRQLAYIERKAEQFGLINAKSVATPMVQGHELEDKEDEKKLVKWLHIES